LTVLAAAQLFYFQQQVTAVAACSTASQTFALGNARCFTIIRTWQSSNGRQRKASVSQEGHREKAAIQ